jgi:hypothetical protein
VPSVVAVYGRAWVPFRCICVRAVDQVWRTPAAAEAASAAAAAALRRLRCRSNTPPLPAPPPQQQQQQQQQQPQQQPQQQQPTPPHTSSDHSNRSRHRSIRRRSLTRHNHRRRRSYSNRHRHSSTTHNRSLRISTNRRRTNTSVRLLSPHVCFRYFKGANGSGLAAALDLGLLHSGTVVIKDRVLYTTAAVLLSGRGCAFRASHSFRVGVVARARRVTCRGKWFECWVAALFAQ